MLRASWPWWLAAAALAAVVAVLSSIPGGELGSHWLFRHDKLIHASVWAVLGALCSAGGTARGWPRWVAVVVAIAAAAGYGALDEWHQSFTPRRDASLGDLAADAIGATIGAIALAAVVYRRRE